MSFLTPFSPAAAAKGRFEAWRSHDRLTSKPYLFHCALLWEVRVITLIVAQGRFEAWREKKGKASGAKAMRPG